METQHPAPESRASAESPIALGALAALNDAASWGMPLALTPPVECAWCPFGTPEPGALYPPNPSDPGEGYYRCALVGRANVWGENPVCDAAAWSSRIQRELAALLPALFPTRAAV